jgi:thymidylate synthase (methanogen type)
MLDSIKGQIGSNGEKGWPVAVRERISFSSSNGEQVAVTFLWTMRDYVLPKLEKGNLVLASNFYTPAGLASMVRNILGNPYIRYIILFGEEYSSKDPSAADGKSTNDLTSANAIRTFFEKGIDDKRRVPGFESSVYFDKNIPDIMIRKVRDSVQLIDLNRRMPNTGLDEKIAEANRLIKTLPKKEPFMERPMTFDYEKMDEPFPYEGGPIIVHGGNIPDSWVKMMYNIYRYGRMNLMNANTDRWVKEINDMVVVIHDPQSTDLTINPFLVPLTKEKIESYSREILSPLLPEGKAYTYGNKLRAYRHPSSEEVRELVNSNEFKDFEFKKGAWLDKNVTYKGNYCEIDQIQDIIEVLKGDPYSKACVAITWHPAEELMRKHKSSPCLIFLQAIIQDDKLNLTVFFRSHDMTQGWPENAYGCAAIQREIAEGIGIKPGLLIIASGSAQIYSNYYQQVEHMLEKYKNYIEAMDKRGNFRIEIEGGEIVAILMHPETSRELERFKGKNAYELMKKIVSTAYSLDTRHAIYLGTELAAAEFALRQNKKYEQDKTFE